MGFFVHLLRFTILATFLHLKYSSSGVESASLSLVTDREALISVRSQIVPDSQNRLSSWDQKVSPCNWTGVLCNKFGSRVVALDLSGFGLVGSISPSIGNLSLLRSLQLQNNQLKGQVPNHITNLFHLRVLNMSSNRLEGPLPPNISKLVELRVIDFLSNKINGNVPDELGNLRKLQVLNLGGNVLHGPVPSSISNISSLTSLNLGTNSLSGSIPSDLSRLVNLRVLNLAINNLTGTVPPSIYNMSSLVYLVLASNSLWGDIPSNVGDTLPNLLVFNFCVNKFTGKIPGSLHNLTNIQIIRMAENHLEGTVPPGLGNLPFLNTYKIGFNRIVGSLDFINSLTNSSQLDFLAFDGNLFEGVIPDSIGNLSNVLTKLFMGGNRISGKIPASIGNLIGLQLLNMSYNSFSGQIPPEIGELKELQELNLAGNQLSGSIPDSLGNLHGLNQFDLSGNQLEGEIPASFGNFLRLLSMDLSNNRITGRIPREILDLPSLSTILNLSKNFLTGPVPEDIGHLESLEAFDLSDNQLSGNVPVSLRTCKSLEKLSMARNLLSGPIPNILAEMKGLEYLDLSSNQLSGSIPSNLQDLQGLRFLNLSFNNLEGSIPSGGGFKHISNVYLEGNPKLSLSRSSQITRGHGKLLKTSIIVVVTVIIALCAITFAFLFSRKRKAKVTEEPARCLKEPFITVSFNELQRATQSFCHENLIGTGSFGSVYKGYLREGISVAVKVMDIKKSGYYKSFIAECEALRNARHRNLVKLITSCSSLDFKNTEFLALVYEFLSNGSLDDWIRGKKKKPNGDGLNLEERMNVAIGIASALDYLHNDCDFPVVHCDLKPSNILLDEEMNVKVGDFGLARLMMDTTSCQVSISSTHVLKGSIGYIPPEYGFGKKPSMAGDVYSFGVILLELFSGKSPTHESFGGEQDLIRWVGSVFPKDVIQILDPELVQLKGDSSTSDPTSFETMEECLGRIIGVGLSCTVRSSDERINIRDAVCRLKAAKEAFLNSKYV